MVFADFVSVEVEALEPRQFINILKVFDCVVADIQDLQTLQFIHVVDVGDLVLLQVQFAKSVPQGQEASINGGELVGLYRKESTPSAICSRLTSDSKFLISEMRFLPRKRDLMLVTPSKFQISLILLEPNSSICSSGSSKFSIQFRDKYFFDFVAEEKQLAQTFEVTQVLNFFDVIVGKIKHLQQWHTLQTFDLHYFVVVQLQLHQIRQLIQTYFDQQIPTMAGIRLFLSRSTFRLLDQRASGAMAPRRQLMKLASWSDGQCIPILLGRSRRAIRPKCESPALPSPPQAWAAPPPWPSMHAARSSDLLLSVVRLLFDVRYAVRWVFCPLPYMGNYIMRAVVI